MRKHTENEPEQDTDEISRRQFLRSAASGGVALAVATALPSDSIAGENKTGSKTKHPYEEILSRCGSEFGDIRTST